MIQIRNVKQQEYSTSQQEIKSNNTRLIFNLIRDHMPISRVELSKLCSLSVSSVSNLVDDLLKKQWIIETELVAASPRGRKSILLEVNNKFGCVATVELLGRSFICTIYDICLKKIIGTRIRNTDYGANAIAETIRGLLRSAKLPLNTLMGIHLIFPGVVDSVSGSLLFSQIFSVEDSPDRHLVINLARQFPQDTHIMISTNGSIIAFQSFLANKWAARLPLLSINIDEAIFAGVVLSSNDNQKNFCFPVEIGHSVVDYHGKLCRCGNYGCAETLLNTLSLFRTLNEKAGMDLEYSEHFGSDCNVESIKKIALALEAENKKVISVLEEYAHILCSVLRSTVDLLSIRSIRIGGDIALLGEKFLTTLKNCFSTYFHLLNNADQVQIELYVSDYEDVRKAATIMCLDDIFSK